MTYLHEEFIEKFKRGGGNILIGIKDGMFVILIKFRIKTYFK